MSTYNNQKDDVYNGQDSTERHVYGEMKFEGVGPSVDVEGNDTQDSSVPVLTIGGTVMNMPKGTNAEVILVGGGDDTAAKMAIVTGPRDKVYKSKSGQSWTQDPLDPKERTGYTAAGYRMASEKSMATWNSGVFEVIDRADGTRQIYLRANSIISTVPIVLGTPPAFQQE